MAPFIPSYYAYFGFVPYSKVDGLFYVSVLTFVWTSQVVKEAIASIDGYDTDRREAVKKAAQSLNLKKEAAMAIFSKAVCIFPLQMINYRILAYFLVIFSDKLSILFRYISKKILFTILSSHIQMIRYVSCS